MGEADLLEVLTLPTERVAELLQLAHEVRLRWCGLEVEVESIVSIKTGGCIEDCGFCSQSSAFDTPVRPTRLDVESLVEAAIETAARGATEFCIVAAVRGPDERLMSQLRAGLAAVREAVDINIAVSLGLLTPEDVEALVEMGVHRYNHNLETARSFFSQVVSSHTWEKRMETITLVRQAGLELCCGGIIGLGESLAQRAELAATLGAIAPEEVPINFLNPRPGTPYADYPVTPADEALMAIGAFRLALPKATLKFAGGREITLGDLGTRDGLLGGVNAIIVGNYLTTLGRTPTDDLDLLAHLAMPVKALASVL